MLLALLPAGVASAQASLDASDASGVMVVEKSWRREVRNPALDDDPFRANDEQTEFNREQQLNAKSNKAKIQQGSTPEIIVRPERDNRTVPQGPWAGYIYSVKVRNTGAQTILAVEWEYVFFDPDTKEEVGRHQYINKVKIRPGKGGDLSWVSTLPPASIIAVKKNGGAPNERYSEQVLIRRVEYADGSVWQRPVK
ncbi:MAG: hypothetical protein DMF67_13940 [Acidobacteria bacterium]|nr:MAG: hypothetical protein DMF67_13940 [Acidobacteriota bacterium]